MASEKDEKAKKKSKKKPKLDFEALSKLSVYDFGVPPHFPKLELPPSKLMERPLVTREEWGAEPPTAVVPLKLPANWILFTYTDTEECDTKEHCLQIVKRLQTQHMRERGLPDIQYNFLAGSDFNVYEGRGWTARPDKNEKYPKLIKKNAVEIAYIGNFKVTTQNGEQKSSDRHKK
ncbi:peptidoglycan-recognition protein LF-like isoform X4 [Macrosteles quadrilineatus]|uniref:peptidoglycan-recognition protein LF-like isoform X4 n=1 Tax=Macrosteles quadrilineatus TaxID=74068 RepID=UPI0023E3158D|nr:peptidoglycan-recognition protein LF-like isoform X4 [Macrosteles quadrilineatus]